MSSVFARPVNISASFLKWIEPGMCLARKAQVDRISSIGRRRAIRAGELLFDVGEQNTRFFVVLSGALAAVRPIGDIEEPVAEHGPGQFTGEINMLSARRSIVRVRAARDG